MGFAYVLDYWDRESELFFFFEEGEIDWKVPYYRPYKLSVVGLV